jgi:hypothetical protein
MGNSEIVTTGRRPQPRSEKLPIAISALGEVTSPLDLLLKMPG